MAWDKFPQIVIKAPSVNAFKKTPAQSLKGCGSYQLTSPSSTIKYILQLERQRR